MTDNCLTHFNLHLQKQKIAQQTEVVETSVAAQPPVMLADYLSSMQAKTFSKMSSIELADMQIPGKQFVSVDAWDELN